MFGKPLTGFHVSMVFGLAFSVIIAVNLTLAFNAVSTFPGLETKNSYVASQSFERSRKSQEALGWDVGLDLSKGQLHLTIDDIGGPVVPAITSATLGRATHVGEDMVPVFKHTGRKFVAQVGALAPGNWNLRLVARAPDGTVFRQRIVLVVKS